MSWRPDNWNTDKLVDEFDETNPATEFDYFEAGADAILEALQPYFGKVMGLCDMLKEHFPDEGKK